MKNVNNFQLAKVQPQGVAEHWLDFLPMSVWRIYIYIHTNSPNKTNTKLLNFFYLLNESEYMLYLVRFAI